MRRVRKAMLVLYVLAGAAVVAALGGSQFGPYTQRFAHALSTPWVRVVLLACLAIVAVHLLVTLVAIVLDRPQPASVRLDGNPDVEVSTAAIASIARRAAHDPDIMIEQVEVHATGRDKAAVRIDIEAIALVPQGLDSRAHLMRQRVSEACTQMLGMTDVAVRVRFLPSKTTTATKE